MSYLDDLILRTKAETNASFIVISHNIASTRRVADYMAILFRSHLASFGAKPLLFQTDESIVRQFLHGRIDGPIGMDETADAESEIAQTLRGAKAEHPPAAPPGGPWRSDQTLPGVDVLTTMPDDRL